jgi:hypothetical protein
MTDLLMKKREGGDGGGDTIRGSSTLKQDKAGPSCHNL